MILMMVLSGLISDAVCLQVYKAEHEIGFVVLGSSYQHEVEWGSAGLKWDFLPG